MLRVSGFFVALAFACLFAADISITTLDPWTEMQRMGLGVVTPDFTAVSDIGWVLVRTVAFAFCGVALGAVGGFLYHSFSIMVLSVGPVHSYVLFTSCSGR